MITKTITLADLLRDSNYKLTQFSEQKITSLEASIFLKETASGQTPYLNCIVRNKSMQQFRF